MLMEFQKLTYWHIDHGNGRHTIVHVCTAKPGEKP